jgi:uncharacterized protein YndB with AHSA1/START domain
MTTTNVKSTITSDQDAVVGEIHIAAPPERVFKALTDPKELKRWFNSPECPVKTWEMDARPGGHYRYVTEKGTIVVNNVSEFECHGEILEIDPPHLLVYSWIANWHDDKSHRTVVRWELTPDAAGTRVKVIHSGLSQETIARKDYSGGWPGVLQNLKTFTEK